MAPRGHTLPEATTESAREARKAFFCELCQKGYARMPEFEAHENSYDHQHRKRLKEMRNLTKDPSAAARQRAAEEKANADSGMKSISLAGASGSSAPSGKKKPVFKSTLPSKDAPAALVAPISTAEDATSDPSGAIRNGWADQAYRPGDFPEGTSDLAPGELERKMQALIEERSKDYEQREWLSEHPEEYERIHQEAFIKQAV
ncbi:Putative Zinc finger C2H2-type [Septoria linicola]|uniref:Zinc finger C2H2-type n=1 Tax=Septoria linicola TaxID=215465 RepID=A0A9Q9AT13_9PEZI|nr:putative Zinc finger C2H2-type [Septoria linicola]USW55282.1 Putative Zinc finger C2H2-type [Septoria linicola]